MKTRNLIFILICISLLLPALCIDSSASEQLNWYIKRNGNKRPVFPCGSESLSAYNTFFIDDNYPDDREEKKLYLTFDAGYENGNVEKILDVLKVENVPAAFFLLDNIIVSNSDLVKRMASEGHLVCNHTKRHKNLSNSTKEEIEADLLALERLCDKYTGVKMSKFFRFPEGKYSTEAINSVYELGYTTVFWSFAYDDWNNSKQMNEEYAIKKILSNTHNGAVVLLHPTSQTNANIMKDLIVSWRQMGYEFGSLDELLNK